LDFNVDPSETFALVGESGCGKTTTGRCIVGLTNPTDGTISLYNENITGTADNRTTSARRSIQIVFQNPHASLNPRHSILHTIGRPLRLYQGLKWSEIRLRVGKLLEAVKLDSSYLDRHPRQLSGGEKQRIAIARALAGDPKLVLCDEVTSALDVSVQAAILNLLTDLQDANNTAYLFVSHNLAVVRHIADKVGIIYVGSFVEVGKTDEIFEPPYHPYTEALLTSVPIPDPKYRDKTTMLKGSVSAANSDPSGCPFHTRCHRKIGNICEAETPPWLNVRGDHAIRCHIPLNELMTVNPAIPES
jgi:peptide/nickel transport system ATP-binding protein